MKLKPSPNQLELPLYEPPKWDYSVYEEEMEVYDRWFTGNNELHPEKVEDHDAK